MHHGSFLPRNLRHFLGSESVFHLTQVLIYTDPTNRLLTGEQDVNYVHVMFLLQVDERGQL